MVVDAQTSLEHQWPYLRSFLLGEAELEETARDTGALVRKREVSSASDLLRLALAYGFCGLSLRETAAWAETTGIASISNVALLKRLRKSAPWLGKLLGIKLASRTALSTTTTTNAAPCILRLVDATSLSKPGSQGTDWRIHLGYNLTRLSIDHVDVTTGAAGETLTRFKLKPGEIVLGDRGYAHRRGLQHILQQQGTFIVRLNWSTLPLQSSDGGPFDLLKTLRAIPDATASSWVVLIAASKEGNLPPMAVRLVALRKTEAAAQEARRKILQTASRKGKAVNPTTLEMAGYVCLVSNVPSSTLSALDVLEVYRFRWQIELVFKRMKGLMYLDELPAKDPELARAFIYSKLLAALLLEDLTERYLDFSPWGYPVG